MSSAATATVIPPICLWRRLVDRTMTVIAVLTVFLVLLPLVANFAYRVY